MVPPCKLRWQESPMATFIKSSLSHGDTQETQQLNKQAHKNKRCDKREGNTQIQKNE